MGECHVKQASQPSLCVLILDRHQSQHDYKQPDNSIKTKETSLNCFKVLKTTQFVKSVCQTTLQKAKFKKIYIMKLLGISIYGIKAVFLKVLYKFLL